MNIDLESLAVNYVNSGNEVIFNDLYNEFIAKYENQMKKYSFQLGGDEHEARAVFEDTFLDVLDKYDPKKGKFENCLNVALRNRKIDRLRQYTRYKAQETFILDGYKDQEDDDFGLLDKVGISKKEIEEIFLEGKKEDDQLQLIVSVMGMANNSKTAQAINLMLNGYSLNQAAIAVGMCHKTLKRNFERIQNRFDDTVINEITLLIA